MGRGNVLAKGVRSGTAVPACSGDHVYAGSQSVSVFSVLRNHVTPIASSFHWTLSADHLWRARIAGRDRGLAWAHATGARSVLHGSQKRGSPYLRKGSRAILHLRGRPSALDAVPHLRGIAQSG